jgi:predicted permease
MRAFVQDLRFAARQLVKSPGFALTAILSLALGIGATTAVFSVIYAALLNPFPYKDADRIVRFGVWGTNGDGHIIWLNGPQIRFLRQSPAIEDTIVMDNWSLPLTGGEYPEDVGTIFISSNGFDFLGEPVLLGRGIQPSDAVEGQDPQPVAVLSYRFWARHFFANPGVIGKTLELNHKSYKIVGVAAPRFIWYSGDVYLPLKISNGSNVRYIVDLRLKPGVTPKAASAALQPLAERFAKDQPKQFPEKFRVDLQRLNDWVFRSSGNTLYFLLGGVAMLLVIGCGNVSILLLARGMAREHEIAVRSAIGAGRGRMVRQLLTESLLLSAIGAALGVAVAYGALAGIKVVLPKYEFAPEVVMGINLPVLLFCVALALFTGILFGLSPALQLSRSEPGKALQSGVRRVAGSGRGRRTHSALISGQIALTLLLLAAAGAGIRSFQRLSRVDLGYDPHHTMSIWIPLRENTYTNWGERWQYFEQLRRNVGQVPGVAMTAISTNATPPQSGTRAPFRLLGAPAANDRMALVEEVSADYFRLLRIPLLEGRIWTETESRNGAHMVVVNQAFAKAYFPNGGAVGHAVQLPAEENRPPIALAAPGLSDAWLQIAGVVSDSRNEGLRKPTSPAIFVPYTLRMGPGTQILVRAQNSPLSLLNAIRHALAEVNADQQTEREVSDLDQWISDQPEWQQEQLVAWLFGAFAILALSLAAIGLYSVVSFSVAQRTNEFGIRMALGAQRGHVLRIVFQSTAISVGIGVLLGAALTLALNSAVAHWIDGNFRDPVLLSAGVGLLALVAAAACLLPARRATRIDPMVALRDN